MTDDSQLSQLFRYDAWTNRKAADVLGSHPANQMDSSIRLFAHIRAAQQIWHARITGSETGGIALWPNDSTLSSDAEILQDMHTDWIRLLDDNREDLDQPVIYQNSSGTSFNTPLAGIMHHLVIHGQHHRAQIASKLSAAGITPPGTDFIYYLREKTNNKTQQI